MIWDWGGHDMAQMWGGHKVADQWKVRSPDMVFIVAVTGLDPPFF